MAAINGMEHDWIAFDEWITIKGNNLDTIGRVDNASFHENAEEEPPKPAPFYLTHKPKRSKKSYRSL